MTELKISNISYHENGPYSLELRSPDVNCLSGPSGSGKTMLFRSIIDLDPHLGEVYLDGISSKDSLPANWRRQIGLLPAESRWWFETVGEHFETEETKWITEFGFEPEIYKWQVQRLSTGEKQRLAMVRLLTNSPKVLLLDEPTASLDKDNVLNAEKIFKHYAVSNNALLFWISHDREQIERVADRYFQLHQTHISEVQEN